MSTEQGYLHQLTGEQVQGVLEQCRFAGFLPPDGQYEVPVALPDTGGPGLMSPVLAGGVLLLTSLSALSITALRRRS